MTQNAETDIWMLLRVQSLSDPLAKIYLTLLLRKEATLDEVVRDWLTELIKQRDGYKRIAEKVLQDMPPTVLMDKP